MEIVVFFSACIFCECVEHFLDCVRNRSNACNLTSCFCMEVCADEEKRRNRTSEWQEIPHFGSKSSLPSLIYRQYVPVISFIYCACIQFNYIFHWFSSVSVVFLTRREKNKKKDSSVLCVISLERTLIFAIRLLNTGTAFSDFRHATINRITYSFALQNPVYFIYGIECNKLSDIRTNVLSAHDANLPPLFRVSFLLL